jgi:hypothetical protein
MQVSMAEASVTYYFLQKYIKPCGVLQQESRIVADYLLLGDLQIGKEWIMKKMGKRLVLEEFEDA